MLTNKFLRKQKRRLLAKKCQVVAALKKLGRQPFDNHAIYKLTVELPLIEKALLRIKHGAYGTCVACRDDIPRGRLAAHPEAARCVDCQTSVERSGHDHR